MATTLAGQDDEAVVLQLQNGVAQRLLGAPTPLGHHAPGDSEIAVVGGAVFPKADLRSQIEQ